MLLSISNDYLTDFHVAHEQFERFFRDSILRIVQEQAVCLRSETIPPFWIFREKLPQVQFRDSLVVSLESLPPFALMERLYSRFHSNFLLV